MADVALFYGERSGGIRTYLDAKAEYARRTGALEHHVLVPGPEERHDAGWHELRSLRLAASNGYRLPLGAGALRDTLRAIEPDVVLLHDPFWRPLRVTHTAQRLGARVLAVHHASIDLDAAGLPGPTRLYRPLLHAWFHHAYRELDGVISVVDPEPDSGRSASMPLRLGLDPAFRPYDDVRRGEHVLYVGRLGREKGVFELLEAAAGSAEPWPLRIIGSGPAEPAIIATIGRLGLGRRVSLRPFIADRRELARTYAQAACVVMPGAFETFGFVGLEAAASGARVVACTTAPSAAEAGALMETFAPGDGHGLLRAIERARAEEPDREAARRLVGRMSWDSAFSAEIADLRRLAR